jgi:hypothetical protein
LLEQHGITHILQVRCCADDDVVCHLAHATHMQLMWAAAYCCCCRWGWS